MVRPGDANETAVSWRTILEHTNRPAGLVLTRQNLPVLDRGPGAYAPADGAARGAYIVAGADDNVDVLLIGTGSEVHIAIAARDLLAADGVTARGLDAMPGMVR